MHSCEIQSHPAVHVQSVEYEEQRKWVSPGLFPSALLKAQEQVMEKEHAWELCYYQREFSSPLSRNILELFIIPVCINHIWTVFVVDTGVRINGIKSEKTAQLRLKKTEGKLQIRSTGGARQDMQGLMTDSIQLRELEVLNMAMTALDPSDFSLRFGNTGLFGFGGIFGQGILYQLDFELDDVVEQFIVLKNRFRAPYPNMLKGSFPYFLVKRADQEISLSDFDNGPRVGQIEEQAVQEHTLAVIHEDNAMGLGIHRLERMDLKTIRQWTSYLDKVEITLKDTMTGRVRLFDDFTFGRIFGDEVFRKRRIRILSSASMILLA